MPIRRPRPTLAGILSLSLALPAAADDWSRTADIRIGKHDFGGPDRRDISFTPHYWSLDACGIEVPVDRDRWQIVSETMARGWPRQRTKFKASEVLKSYTRPHDKYVHNPEVNVSFSCGPSDQGPKAKLAQAMSHTRGGITYRVHWGTPSVFRHPDFGDIHFADHTTVFQNGERYSGISAYWTNAAGDLIGLRTSIEEMNAQPDTSRLPEWNTAFSQQLILASNPL